MAKIYGLFGAMTGKVADAVMVVRNGEQIVRKYQPVVSNPSTPGQIEVRAKLKLVSQLAAVLGADIAMPRQGAKSSRNLFVQKNYPLMTYNNSTANIDLNKVQLTSSVVGLPSVIVNRSQDAVRAELGTIPSNVNRVVYVGLVKRSDGALSLLGSAVVSDPGTASAAFVGSLPFTTAEVVVLAYGVRDNTERAKVAFGNLQAVTAENVAKLIVSRSVLESDITLTETVGATLAAGSAA